MRPEYSLACGSAQSTIATTGPREIILSSLVATVEDSGGTVFQGITDDTVLLNSGLDSLGFAILVSRLEEELGYDPFSIAEDPFYPATFGEFVSFYEKNDPR